MWRDCNTSIRSCRSDQKALQHKSVLQANEALDQTDTQTDEGSDNEHEKQRLSSNHIRKFTDPTNGLGNDQTDTGQNFSHAKTSLQTDQTLDQANAQTNHADTDEHQNQRIAGNGTGKITDPRHTGGNDLTHTRENGCNSNSCSLLNTFFHFLMFNKSPLATGVFNDE